MLIDIDATLLKFDTAESRAGNSDEAQHVLAPALRTIAALGLSRLLIDEGPQMLLLATDNVVADQFTAADPTTSANVREFASSLAATSTA